MTALPTSLLDFLQNPAEDLNDKIYACINNKALNFLINYKSFNGSPFPFIGPEWLEVDFDSDVIYLRCIPFGHRANKTNSHLVGFCEDVSFDYYPEVAISGEEKNKIVMLVDTATTYAGGLINKSVPLITEAFANLNNYVQSLGTKFN